MRCLVVLILVAGCTPGVPVALDVVEGEGVVERLGSGAFEHAVPLSDHRVVTSTSDSVSLHDPWSGVLEPVAPGASLVSAAIAEDGTLLVATDAALLSVGDVVGPSALGDAVALPLRGLTATEAGVWIHDQDGLWVLREGWLHDVRVDGEPPGPLVAVGPRGVWAADDRSVRHLEETEDGWRVSVRRSLAAESLAVDGAGSAFVVSGGVLFRHQEGWSDLVLPGSATRVWADPRAPGAWVETTAGLVHLDGDRGTILEVDVPHDATVDTLGRLLRCDGAGLERLATGRLVAVVGLESAVEAVTEVLLVPNDREGVDVVEAAIDGSPVPVQDWRVTIDPAVFAGQHTLTARVRYRDGGVAEARPASFVAGGDVEVTWQTHIEPLHRRHCAVCHEGGTETVLDGPEAWQGLLDSILDEVESARMPLGGTPLTPAEIARVQTWADGGFP